MTDASETADRLGIHELYGRYCLAIDSDDRDALAECFSPDAVWESNLYGSQKGRAEIATIVDRMVALGDGRPLHQATSVVVTRLDHAAGRGAATGRWLVQYPGEHGVIVGRYDDEVVRGDDGVWRFRRRRLIHLPGTIRR
jgi:hypothetical protein